MDKIISTVQLLTQVQELAENDIIDDSSATKTMEEIYCNIDPYRECDVDILLKKIKSKNTVYFAKVKEDAVIPIKDGENAGYDIYPCFSEDYIFISPYGTKLIPTGIASAIPKNYYFQLEERGSSGGKGIKCSAGVIDSGYRGEWFLAVTNCNDVPVIISKLSKEELLKRVKKVGTGSKTYIYAMPITAGDIIAHRQVSDNLSEEIIYPYNKALFQAVLHKVHNEIKTKVISYEELKEMKSQRGDGNLGSSGK